MDEAGSVAFKRKTQLLIGLLISSITILLCLGTVELAGYLWERNTAQGDLGWTLVASRRMPLQRHGTEEQSYYLLEPNRDYNWEGIPVGINSRGLRTEEFAVPKPADAYRILNIGDSVAFGWEVRLEDTYGKQLEQMLAGRDDGLRYEVINAGVPGWNLEMERAFLLQEGLSYEPNLILLDITLVNDIYGTGPAVAEAPNLFDWLRDHTYGWPFFTTQTRFLMAGRRGPEAIPVLNPPENADAYYPLDKNHPMWDKIWNVILDMQQAAQERSIRFIIVAFPTAFQLNSAAHPDVPQRVLSERANQAGIEFVDIQPVYQQICDNAGAGACEGFENLLFADVWMHPNTYGHELVARALFKQKLEPAAR